MDIPSGSLQDRRQAPAAAPEPLARLDEVLSRLQLRAGGRQPPAIAAPQEAAPSAAAVTVVADKPAPPEPLPAPLPAPLSAPAGRPHIVIVPQRGQPSLGLGQLLDYGSLFRVIVRTTVLSRYKQTIVGIAWSVLQPLLMMIVFTVFFGLIMRVPSNGFPYPVFMLAGLLPWNYFNKATSEGSSSILTFQGLVKKVYFPRMLLPLAPLVSGLVDFVAAFAVVLLIAAVHGIYPQWTVVLLLPFLLLAALAALSVSLWMSVLQVKYRDIGHLLPFLLQIWMFCTPIIYPSSMVPGWAKGFYWMNPMVGVVEGFRWALLGHTAAPDPRLMLISVAVVAVILAGGLMYFRRSERWFSDFI